MSEVKNSDFTAKLENFWRDLCKEAKKAKTNILTDFARWVDPKLQPYRDSKAKNTPRNAPETSQTSKTEPTTSGEKNRSGGSENAQEANPAPKTADFSDFQTKNPSDVPNSREEFFEILYNIPFSVVSQSQRRQFEAILNLDFTLVEELMLPASRIVYVDKNEILGPLTLDRLFRSGMKHFPVVDQKNEIIGCIHTARLNSLDIKQSSKAYDILDPNIYYIRSDYTLEQALEVFLRTESYFLLVVDKYGKIIGILNLTDLAEYLFGKFKNDGFLHDDDRISVAKRHFLTDDRRKN